MDETFGERLRRLREESSLSPSDLAHRVMVTEGAIRHLESGHTKNASFTLGLRLAKVLKVSPSTLAFGQEYGDLTQRAPDDDRLQKLEDQVEALTALPQQVQTLAGAVDMLRAEIQSQRTVQAPGGKRSRPA